MRSDRIWPSAVALLSVSVLAAFLGRWAAVVGALLGASAPMILLVRTRGDLRPISYALGIAAVGGAIGVERLVHGPLAPGALWLSLLVGLGVGSMLWVVGGMMWLNRESRSRDDRV